MGVLDIILSSSSDDDDFENEELEEPPRKKRSTIKNLKNFEPEKDNSEEEDIFEQPKLERCNTCEQVLDETTPIFQRHEFTLFKSESTAVQDPSVSIQGMDDCELQDFILEDFVIYDDKDHLVHLDAESISKKLNKLKFSGKIKSIIDDPNAQGVPVVDAGPLEIWWITGYNAGEDVRIALTTRHGQYYLKNSSPQFEEIYHVLCQKVKATKLVYSCLQHVLDQDNHGNYNYEDLVEEFIREGASLNFSEQDLLLNGKFICNQIISHEEHAEEDEETILEIPALKELAKVANAGTKVLERRNRAKKRSKKSINVKYDLSSDSDDDAKDRRPMRFKKPVEATKATTTPLVSHFFQSVFGTEMQDFNDKSGCGSCEPCKRVDCGSCQNCLKMKKFLGNQADHELICDRRQCDAADVKIEPIEDSKRRRQLSQKSTKVDFSTAEKLGSKDGKKYYDSVAINGETFHVQDHALVHPEDCESDPYICKILSIFISNQGCKSAHVRWFTRGSEAIFRNVCDPKELFAAYDCEDIALVDLMDKVQVEYCPVPDNWSMLGGTQESLVTATTYIAGTQGIYWFRHLYDSEKARIEKVPHMLLNDDETGMSCNSCIFMDAKYHSCTPRFDAQEEMLYFKEQAFQVGDAVMLLPYSFDIKSRQKKGFKRKMNQHQDEEQEVVKDPEIYTEFWRKTKKTTKRGNTEMMNDPFDIGIIQAFKQDEGSSKIQLKVRALYRPENTGFNWKNYVCQQDVNKLFWTEQCVQVQAENIEGKCLVLPKSAIKEEQPFLWTSNGMFRFYYEQAFDVHSGETQELSAQAADYCPPSSMELHDFPKLSKPLNMMDIFSGCGGLSIGLEQAGVAKTKWGIEWDRAAAKAFELNHPGCQIIVDDVNKVLKDVMSENHEILPKKGQVQLLVGGPPCQGFSLLNSFTEGDASRFKNSLISTYLSFCDYYRPDYFILENVKNFAAFNQGQVLRLCMRALVLMGYQCQFGVLQAGHFGVPQNRKRAILLAAAPHVTLPHFPAATHVFEKMSLAVNLDEKLFDVNSIHWRNNSAPYRCINVRDAISDLPASTSIQTCSPPASYFQRMVRWNPKTREFSSKISHHEARSMSIIVSARISMIPKTFGADWRDLPNAIIQLPDGRKTQKIKYPYIDYVSKRPAVCACATKKKAACSEMDRQELTLIPWALIHTGSNHNNWDGLYSRVHWDSYFSTTVTNIHPDGKQGRVIHPQEDRLLSVRECARSQGFPDTAHFYGSTYDKYRQIGNAVPPPMGRALGISILCAQAETEDIRIIY